MSKLESLSSDLFRPLVPSEIQMVSGAGSTMGKTSSSTVSRTYSGGTEMDSNSDSESDGGIDWEF